jgi:histidinol-phosphatase (PHP family)
MFPHQLEDYVASVLALKEKYKDKIDIRLGLEVEYYPDRMEGLLKLIEPYPIEYFILGQHWCGNEMDAPYNGKPTDREEDLARYCSQVMDAMQTGLFTYLAHPDLIHFVGSDRVYRHHMGRLCREARSCGVPLEINLLGLATNRHYPDIRLWEVVAEESCPVVIGVDAHSPEAFADKETESRAQEMVSRFGLNLLETPELRCIL